MEYKKAYYNEVHIIDPSYFVARELYEALEQQELFNSTGDMFNNSEFFISVPNQDNRQV